MRLIDADALKEKAHMIEIFDKQWVVDEIEIDMAPTVAAVPLKDVYHVIAGHSNYHGDAILAALTCISEGKEVKPINPLGAVPVAHGEWNYTIKKGSCADYSVTAKCSKCGWDWFSKDGVGNYSAVFGAFVTNGDSKPEEAKTFLLENAKSNNKLNYCPNCGADMRGSEGKE